MIKKTPANNSVAKLSINNKTYSLPIYKASEGNDVIDITKLHSLSGYFTYDPGFTSTASCKSNITFIDGEKGILRHRGYRIEELAERSTFLETSYLAIYGELPSKPELIEFETRVTNHTMLHDQMNHLFRGFRRDAHPMAIMCGVVGALSAFYHDSLDIHDPHQRMTASRRIIAKASTIAAYAFKYSQGQPFVYPDNKLDYASNFLRMCFAVLT